MKRFDIVIADFLAHESDRVYHSEGEFVEAEVAQVLLEALKAVLHDCGDLDMVPSNQPGRDISAFDLAVAAIAKAEGADHEQAT